MMDNSDKFKNINKIITETCYKLETSEGYCPPIISEIYGHVTCWHATPPGSVAKAECPNLEVFDTQRFVYKECGPNGTWFVHPGNTENGSLWVNYTTCIDLDKFEFSSHLNRLFIIGYSISLVALIISIVIFCVLRSLSCTRIRIHIQLFLSFILNNTIWIVWYLEVVSNAEHFVDDNPIWCQAVEILKRYFLFANYMWMFCEGLHLHISLVVVFVRNELALKWFLLIGWGIPVPVIITYCAVRIFHYNDTHGCWLNDRSKAEIIYRGLIYITLAASIIFLINVLRVIVKIIEPNPQNANPARVKKAMRAACILIPLFGLQCIVIPFRPENPAPLYDYITVVLTTGQGLCVSCLFCFANQDVHHAIKGCISRRLYSSRWGNYMNAGIAESGVTTANHTNSIRML